MKRKFKGFWFFLMVVAMTFGLVLSGCDSLTGGGNNGNNNNEEKDKDEENEPKDEDAGSDEEDVTTVSFESFSTPSIIVDNLTSQRLIAFKGSVNPNNLISGIPAYASSHGLKRDPALFGTTSDFILVLITEEQYNANKSNLGSLENSVFAKIFAFYNNSGTNNNHFQISSKIGGSGRLNISNPTTFDAEIRSGGPTGEILGYAPRQMTSGTVLYLNAPEDYDIYTVFKFFNRNDGELYSVIPRYRSGALTGKPYMKSIALVNTLIFNINEVYSEGDFNLSSGGIYIRVINNSGTAVRFTQGDEERATSTGLLGIGPANSNVFTIQVTRNADGTYPESQSIAQLKIGTTNNPLNIPSQIYKLDYMYEIEVAGSNASTLELGTMTEKDKVNLDQMFGL
jgi:hypothetical protein